MKILGRRQRWYLPENLVFATRRQEIHWVKQETWELVQVDIGMSVDPNTQENSIKVVFKRIQNEEAR